MKKLIIVLLPVQLWITTVFLFSIFFILVMLPMALYVRAFFVVIAVASLVLSLPALAVYLAALPALKRLTADVEHKLLLFCCLNIMLIVSYGVAVHIFLGGPLLANVFSRFFLCLASASAITTLLYWNRLKSRYFNSEAHKTGKPNQY